MLDIWKAKDRVAGLEVGEAETEAGQEISCEGRREDVL